VGLTPTLLLLDRLEGLWNFLWGLYGRDALHQARDDAPSFGMGLALSLQLLPEIGHLLPEIFDALRPVVRRSVTSR
jgi:hypothetical protein